MWDLLRSLSPINLFTIDSPPIINRHSDSNHASFYDAITQSLKKSVPPRSAHAWSLITLPKSARDRLRSAADRLLQGKVCLHSGLLAEAGEHALLTEFIHLSFRSAHRLKNPRSPFLRPSSKQLFPFQIFCLSLRDGCPVQGIAFTVGECACWCSRSSLCQYLRLSTWHVWPCSVSPSV